MNLTLRRTDFNSEGIFGTLCDENDVEIAVTLEHAYGSAPKLPAGIYTCQRGQHHLHSGPIETFEVLGVPGHTGILIHPGNTQADSEGCVLIGMGRYRNSILASREAFARFLDLQAGLEQFTLTVV